MKEAVKRSVVVIILIALAIAAGFGADKLFENYTALMGAIIKAKPAAAKGQYIKSCVVASTMGPGVKMATAKL